MKELLTKEQIQPILNALEQEVGKKVILVDMDGVIADFDKGVENWSRDMGITVDEFKDKKLYRQPGFYASLELVDGAKEAIEQLAINYEVFFLSAPSWNGISSFSEKRVWIEKHFGEWARKRMDLSFRKGWMLGHYLIDDRTKYGAGKFLGEHILFGSQNFSDWKKVVEHLNTFAS